MGITNEEVLEPIPSNFVERAIAAVKMRGGKKNAESNPEQPVSDYQVQPPPSQHAAVEQPTVKKDDPPKFFKDANGNEFKIEGGILYAKTWKTLNAKVRIVKSANKKEIPMDGKIVQVFGWVRVEDSVKGDDDDVDISKIEDESHD